MRRDPATLLLAFAAAVIWLLLPIAAMAAGGKRLALVIGNSTYESFYSLPKAAGDAEAIAAALEDLGFEVNLLKDASREGMNAALDDLGKRADNGAEVALFYFTGHGFQLDGIDYLLPSDAVLEQKDAIDANALRVEGITTRLATESRPTLILIDASRNNPLPPELKGSDARDGLSGLAAPANTYLAFAAAPGGVTNDGSGEHGPFATALVQSLAMPDRSVSDIMTLVRNSVRTKTADLQSPWDANGLSSPFFFNPGTMEPLFPEIEMANLEAAGMAASEEPAVAVAAVAVPAVTPEEPAVEAVAEAPAPETLPEPIAVVLPEPEVVPEPSVAALPEPKAPVVGTLPEADEPQVADVPPEVVATPTEPELAAPDVAVFPPVETVEDPIEVAKAVQSELKRVGCYSRTIDGEWGPGSRSALKRYFDSKDIAALGEEPSRQIRDMLVAETGTVCEPEPVVVVVRPTAPVVKPQVAVTTPKPDPTPAAPTIKPSFGSGSFR